MPCLAMAIQGSCGSRSILKTHGCASTVSDIADIGNGQGERARQAACQSMTMTGVADRGCRLEQHAQGEPLGQCSLPGAIGASATVMLQVSSDLCHGPQRRINALAMMGESIFISAGPSG